MTFNPSTLTPLSVLAPDSTVTPAPRSGRTQSSALDDAHAVFRRWLGDDYDTDALDISLATVAVERLDGDPLWLLLISGSGNAKTETVVACAAAGGTLVSTISSAGALLSGTPRKEMAKGSTGGLLRVVGSRGTLIVKDVTSILSMDRNARAEVLAALREVYDGKWDRTVGVDGGRTLSWEGRLAFLGAVTTAWDQAHAVVASMGDRFVSVRMDSTAHREASGRRAIGNTGSEVQMRSELAAAAGGVIEGMKKSGVKVTEEETDVLLAAADLVTLARTAVEFDYRGNVIDAHAPEMPTRFAKQLAQVLRGAVAIGRTREDALALAIRAARDSMPPLRLLIVDDLVVHPDSPVAEVRKRIGKPRSTVDRQLQALHMLNVVALTETESSEVNKWDDAKTVTRWTYSLAEGIDPSALLTRNVGSGTGGATTLTRNVGSGTGGEALGGLPTLPSLFSRNYSPTNLVRGGTDLPEARGSDLLCPGCGLHVSHPDLYNGWHVGCAP